MSRTACCRPVNSPWRATGNSLRSRPSAPPSAPADHLRVADELLRSTFFRRCALKPISRRAFLAASGASLSLAAIPHRLTSLQFSTSQRAQPDYEATLESLTTHPIPRWYEDAKFGIFFHIGVYTVPAWAPLPPGPINSPGGGQYYAEQYMVQLMAPESATCAHHRDMYGTQLNYDDFIPQFKAKKFDPERWIKLVEDAGARYFVPTAKHREGFSNFRTSTTHRNSVDMGPRRDLIKDLVETARRT